MAPSLSLWRPSSRSKRSNSEASGQLHARWGDSSISAPNGGGWNQHGVDPAMLHATLRSGGEWSNASSINAMLNTPPQSPPLEEEKPRTGITITIPLPWSRRTRRPSLDHHVPTDIVVPSKPVLPTVPSPPAQTTSPRGGVMLPPSVVNVVPSQSPSPFHILSPVSEDFSRDGSEECSPSAETPIFESPMSVISPTVPDFSTIEQLSRCPSIPPRQPSRAESVRRSPDLNRHSSDRSDISGNGISLVENQAMFRCQSRGPVADDLDARRSPFQDRASRAPISQEPICRRRAASRERGSRRAASQEPTGRRAMSRAPITRQLSYSSLKQPQCSPTTTVSSSSEEDEIEDRDTSGDDMSSLSRKMRTGRVGVGAGGFYNNVVRDYQKIAKNVEFDSLSSYSQRPEIRGLDKVLSSKVKVADSVEYVGSQVLVPSAEELWG